MRAEMIFERIVCCEYVVAVQYIAGSNSHENRSGDKRRTVELEVIGMKRTAIKLLVQPSDNPYFGGAECL